MATNQELMSQIAALEAIVDNQNTKISILDSTLQALRVDVDSVVDPTAEIESTVQDVWDDFVDASGDFITGHAHRAMEIPLGTQDGGHTTYYCPSGQWLPTSIEAFINGRSLPSEYIMERSASSIRIGGGLPLEMWPDLTIAEKKELRVTYALTSIDASGTTTPSGFLDLRSTHIDFTATVSGGNRIDVEAGASGYYVTPEAGFNWPEQRADFAYDNYSKAWFNGSLLRKEIAEPWVPLLAYGIGDRVTYSGNYYQCNTLHYASGTWSPTAAYWDNTGSNDITWIDGSGAMLGFDIDAEDHLYIEIPEYI